MVLWKVGYKCIGRQVLLYNVREMQQH